MRYNESALQLHMISTIVRSPTWGALFVSNPVDKLLHYDNGWFIIDI